MEDKKETNSPDKTMGRPSLCTAEMVRSAEYYSREWKSLDTNDVLPSIEGLALYLGVTRKTIYNWLQEAETDKNHQDFLYICEQILIRQFKQLSNGGLQGTYNSAITKLMMSKHGYVDKAETENKHSFDLPEDKKKQLDQILKNDDKQTGPTTNDDGISGGEAVPGK
ncbi:MAG: terminase small subunit [Candidatus Paceibacterota bacterium]|jgi:hypothetical protein